MVYRYGVSVRSATRGRIKLILSPCETVSLDAERQRAPRLIEACVAILIETIHILGIEENWASQTPSFLRTLAVLIDDVFDMFLPCVSSVHRLRVVGDAAAIMVQLWYSSSKSAPEIVWGSAGYPSLPPGPPQIRVASRGGIRVTNCSRSQWAPPVNSYLNPHTPRARKARVLLGFRNSRIARHAHCPVQYSCICFFARA